MPDWIELGIGAVKFLAEKTGRDDKSRCRGSPQRVNGGPVDRLAVRVDVRLPESPILYHTTFMQATFDLRGMDLFMNYDGERDGGL